MLVVRSAPQLMKPMPMGSGDWGSEIEERRVRACWRCMERSETSVPAPMKPMPPFRGLVFTLLVNAWLEIVHGGEVGR